MSIFYPDNTNRRNRVYQLVNEASTYLTNAHTNFAILQNQLVQLNTKVDSAYKAINITELLKANDNSNKAWTNEDDIGSY
ncbi:hypothetical protein PaeCFBP13512_22460 [Paenibacillus sp. CFBP13512]|uniref:hypothetical protein n=1 Tax=Paenibacillus sp. CFBP13512 TaxID=2184007 RepID=UPI0010C14EF6|nr:hypothetical protein [Paenibacillus sp. CFBP13512]TKJ83782.1 hypothetical protein PaeCFBP13512_22460 [Paenibacillus sp. CFBP13512]